MTEGDISAAVAMWKDQGAGDLPWGDIERALRRLPDSGICAVSDDATALFMVARTDTVFTVSVDGGSVMLSSRPLDSGRLTVRLQWAEGSSRWTFGYVGEPDPRERWQHISGSVTIDGGTGRERLDDREQFARAVAERAGWIHGTEEPSAAEPPAEGAQEEPGQDEPRWRARTDVWGRPLDVRRG
jgi:hypothetical protein